MLPFRLLTRHRTCAVGGLCRMADASASSKTGVNAVSLGMERSGGRAGSAGNAGSLCQPGGRSGNQKPQIAGRAAVYAVLAVWRQSGNQTFHIATRPRGRRRLNIENLAILVTRWRSLHTYLGPIWTARLTNRTALVSALRASEKAYTLET